MALVSGPVMSLDASGTVAGTLTFSKWKGRNYVRQTVTPANPRSKGQVGSRAMMTFLSKAWKDAIMTTVAQATWDTLAKQKVISPFNAFVSFNRKNWTQFLAPVHEPADARAHTLSTLAAPTVTGAIGEINISQVITTIAAGWGILYFFSTTPAFTPAVSDLRLVIDIAGHSNGDTIQGTVLNLPHGTNWYYSYANFTDDGHLAARSATAGPIAVT